MYNGTSCYISRVTLRRSHSPRSSPGPHLVGPSASHLHPASATLLFPQLPSRSWPQGLCTCCMCCLNTFSPPPLHTHTRPCSHTPSHMLRHNPTCSLTITDTHGFTHTSGPHSVAPLRLPTQALPPPAPPTQPPRALCGSGEIDGSRGVVGEDAVGAAPGLLGRRLLGALAVTCLPEPGT